MIMKVKEAIMRLRNKNEMGRDIGQTLGLPKLTVWYIITKKNSNHSSGKRYCGQIIYIRGMARVKYGGEKELPKIQNIPPHL